MATPPELFWVDMKLSPAMRYKRLRAGVRGGKRSSLRAALDAKSVILATDPDAKVRIFSTGTDWKEIK